MKHVALVNKLMPLYRLAVFHELSKKKTNYEFTCFGDTKEQGGIEIIPWQLANNVDEGGVNWIKTSNFFYISERLLWQTGIVKRILFSKYDYFIFEGAVYHLPTWIFAALCRLRGKKVLFWTHGFKGFDRGLKKVIRTWYFKMANALLLYGNFSRNLMIENGFNPQKLFVVYNSLDTTKQFNLMFCSSKSPINDEKSKIFQKPDLFTVIFIGRLVKAKQIQFLLNAVNEFSKNGKPINCIIIGDGPERVPVTDFVSTNNLENNIYLAGAIYEEEQIYKYFKMAQLMVSPGNVGLNCMHSLAYGVPVLTHDNFMYHGPEVEAIIPGETGLLFQYNNNNDLILKIDEWRTKQSEAADIIDKCQAVIVNKYNPVTHAEKIIEAIENV
jgi:glycosyltransferase involved in cell wall biosynthesis